MPAGDSMQRELEFLYQALGEPVGIVLRTDNPKISKQRLYTAKRASGDPDLEVLSFHTSPVDPQEIWVLRKPQPATSALGE